MSKTLTRNIIAVDPQHLKVKEQDISLTKNCCTTVSIHEISSIHKFAFKIQHILGSDELKAMAILDHAHPKIIESTFSFSEFITACKKSVCSMCSFLRYSQFKSPVTRLVTPIFDHTHPKSVPSVNSSDTVN